MSPNNPHPNIFYPPIDQSDSIYPKGGFSVGIEMELILDPKNDLWAQSQASFNNTLVVAYNSAAIIVAQERHPRMQNIYEQTRTDQRFDEWSVDEDITITPQDPNSSACNYESFSLRQTQTAISITHSAHSACASYCSYSQSSAHFSTISSLLTGTGAVEIISPIFRIHEGPEWRKHMEFLWQFLRRRYRIIPDHTCGTHVHVSIQGGYTLENLKTIARSIIHFECAWEYPLRAHRVGNGWCKSNWLDNPNFGYQDLSRVQAMEVIRGAKNHFEVIALMNPNDDKNYAWNFVHLLGGLTGTIEFRRGAASRTEKRAMMWVEVATAFVNAAIKFDEEEDNLLNYPPTVLGLKKFLDKARVPNGHPTALYDSVPELLEEFFNGAHDNAWHEPTEIGIPSPEDADLLARKKMHDERNQLLAIQNLS